MFARTSYEYKLTKCSFSIFVCFSGYELRNVQMPFFLKKSMLTSYFRIIFHGQCN